MSCCLLLAAISHDVHNHSHIFQQHGAFATNCGNRKQAETQPETVSERDVRRLMWRRRRHLTKATPYCNIGVVRHGHPVLSHQRESAGGHSFYVSFRAFISRQFHVNFTSISRQFHVNFTSVPRQFRINFTSISHLSIEICSSSPLENIYSITYIRTVDTQSRILRGGQETIEHFDRSYRKQMARTHLFMLDRYNTGWPS